MNNIIIKARERQVVQATPARMLESFFIEQLTTTIDKLGLQAWESNDIALDATYNSLRRFRQLRQALVSVSGGEKEQLATPAYLVSASFLREAFQGLTKTHNEDLLYVTGPEQENQLFALTRLVTFKVAHRSIGHATPDPDSQLNALSQLDKNGERLLAMFHSHPGSGATATAPSSVDLSTQRQLETIGYPTVAAIFSRDGFIRFYSAKRAFRITVSGTGCEQVKEHLFRLTGINKKHPFSRRLP